MINSTGAPLLIGQIVGGGQIVEGYFDGTNFQVLSPAPIPPAATLPNASPVVTGVIYEWPAEVPPPWGLECNGALPLISSFPNLYNVIGTRFGGDGVNTFGLPDKRGAFTRGWDHGRGLDPNATTRTGNPFGNPTVVGDHVGSWETSGWRSQDLNGQLVYLASYPTFPSPQSPPFVPLVGYEVANYASVDRPIAFGIGVGSTGEEFAVGPGPGISASTLIAIKAYLTNITGGLTETRPVNIDMMYVIAF
jgi:hypothetical protein